jgi:DNA-binding MarR family transcriptional regulator
MPAAKKTTKTAKPASKSPRATRTARADDDLIERFDFQRDSLGYTLRRAQMRAYDLFFEMMGALELSPARVTALSIVATEPDIHQATLAKRLNIAGPSVMKLVDALESAGFISRKDVAGDKRRYSLVLTPAGRGTLEQVKSALAAYEARLARALSKAERAQLMALLERLAT